MLILRFGVLMLSIGMMVLVAAGAWGQTTATGSGQDYPHKVVRIITAGVGGGADLVSRLIASGISGSLGQQVVVENRGGGGGLVPGEMVSKAAPDGYTLLIYGNTIWLAPFLRERTPYDPVKDFSPITLAGSSPNILAIHPSLPVKNVAELIALARAKPGQLNFGTAGNGSSSHLSGELFKALAKVDIVRVNYKGAGATLTDLVAGHVQMTFGTSASVTPYVRSGKLRALAVTSKRPSALLSELPPIAAAGLPGYESVSLHAVFAPARTPPVIINRLNQEIVRFLKTAEAKERLLSFGVEAVGTSPDEFATEMKAEMSRMGKVIRDAGIRED